jgi:hypothetical protein
VRWFSFGLKQSVPAKFDLQKQIVMRLVVLMSALALLPTVAIAADTSCTNVRHGVTEAQRREWWPSINRQLGGKLTAINQIFAQGDWVVVFVDLRSADSPFLFFHGNPAKTQFVTMWSGAAMRSERKAVQDWTLINVPGIPHSQLVLLGM